MTDAATGAGCGDLVSVIIPAFNPGPYLAEAVASVLDQTTGDWELIVVDDGSTAPFPELVADDRIRIVRQANGGPASARNLGVEMSRGTFVAFLDADDLWMPGKLARQVALMARQPDLSLCTTQFRHIDEHGVDGAIGYGRPMSRSDLLMTGDGICTSTVMVRRTALAGSRFLPDFQPAEDFELWVRISGERPEGFVPSVEVLYRHHDANLTLDYVATWRATQRVYRRHPDPIGASGLAGYRAVFTHQAWDAARRAGPGGAVRHVASAVRISPLLTASLAGRALRAKAAQLIRSRPWRRRSAQVGAKRGE